LPDSVDFLNLIRTAVPLAKYTSWLVGGCAEFLAQPKSSADLYSCLKWAKENHHAVTVLSGGTNVLISDQGIQGLVILLGQMSGLSAIEEDGRLKVTCLAGTPKSALLKIFLKYQLEPALFLAGLPGDVGGGVAMNAGVGEMIQPREFVELIDWIEVLKPSGGESGQRDDFQLKLYQRGELNWSYRHCTGWQPGVITRVSISWPLEPKPDILARVREANKIRLAKQPLDLPSCGSVFINPPGSKSGQLIEQAGLKGFSIGGAEVSEKHANFIVNKNNATANDIQSVIEHVRKVVLERSGILLKTEVVYLGRWS